MREVVEKDATFQGSLWYLLLLLLEYERTFLIEEHGRNFSPAVIFGFLVDKELAQEILVKIVETPRAELLQDCAPNLCYHKAEMDKCKT